MGIAPFNRPFRAILSGLADVLVPLHDWAPSNGGDRNRLRPSHLGVIEFIEGLIAIDASGRNEKWAARVQSLEASPLRLSPHEQPVYWRGRRGLEADPAFNIKDTGNLPRSYAAFYEKFLPPLTLYASTLLAGPGPWPDAMMQQVADGLAANAVPGWPPPQELKKAQECVVDFTNDIVASLMSMRSVGSPMPFALLDALKEGRRPGNRYTAKDAADATASFKAALDLKMSAGS
jgi:hypothetical protein